MRMKPNCNSRRDGSGLVLNLNRNELFDHGDYLRQGKDLYEMPGNRDASNPGVWPYFLESCLIKARPVAPNIKAWAMRSDEDRTSIQSRKLFQESQCDPFRL